MALFEKVSANLSTDLTPNIEDHFLSLLSDTTGAIHKKLSHTQLVFVGSWNSVNETFILLKNKLENQKKFKGSIFESVSSELSEEIVFFTNPTLLNSLSEQSGVTYKYTTNGVVIIGSWDSMISAEVLLNDLKNELNINSSFEQTPISKMSPKENFKTHVFKNDKATELTSKTLKKLNKFTCGNCKGVFNEKSLLDAHITSCNVKSNNCSICSATFRRKSALRFHLNRSHFAENTNISEVSDSVTVKREPGLPNSFDDLTNKEHDLAHNNKSEFHENFSLSLITEKFRKYQKSITCVYCSKDLKTVRKIKSHIQLEHPEKCLVCKNCTKMFVNASDLSKHHRSCTPKRLTCPNCNQVFTTPAALKSHKKDAHDTIPKFECQACSHKTLTAHSLVLHIMGCPQDFNLAVVANYNKYDHPNTTDEKLLIVGCPHCQEEIPKSNLADHIRTVHPDKCIICHKCEISCLNIHDLTRHLLNYHDDDYKKCNKCDISFEDFNSWKNHQYIVHRNAALFRCPSCDEYFENRSRRATHIFNNHLIDSSSVSKKELKPLDPTKFVVCEKCGKSCLSEKAYQFHMKYDHMGERFKCNICFKMFKIEKSLIQHMKKHQVMENVLKDQLSQDTHVCSICKKTFKSELSLHNHIIKHSTNTSSLICKECGQRFNSRGTLHSHVQTKHKMLRFECDICNKKLRRPRVPHACLIKKEKTHVCKICGRAFAWKESLKTHENFHKNPELKKFYLRNNVKPGSCDICGQKFSCSKYIPLHKRKAHFGIRVRCPECEKLFTSDNHVKRHLVRKHNFTNVKGLKLEKTTINDLIYDLDNNCDDDKIVSTDIKSSFVDGEVFLEVCTDENEVIDTDIVAQNILS